jgi:hypothetical protein
MPQDAPKRELSPIQKLNIENLNFLKQEITGKKITLKSNLYQDRKVREYMVKEVREERIVSASRSISGIRLYNPDVDKDLQPFLKFPTEKISKTKEANQVKLTLAYRHEINIERSFRHLHKQTRPDLEIYIYYESKED